MKDCKDSDSRIKSANPSEKGIKIAYYKFTNCLLFVYQKCFSKYSILLQNRFFYHLKSQQPYISSQTPLDILNQDIRKEKDVKQTPLSSSIVQ